MKLGPVYEDGGKLWQEVLSFDPTEDEKPNGCQCWFWGGWKDARPDGKFYRYEGYRIPAQPAAPSVAPTDNPKDLIGITKPQLNLIPASAMILESSVMQLGAAKYGPFNWRENGVKASIYVAACLRHLLAWQDGQNEDPESGKTHLAHARACLGILIDAESLGKLVDDRPPAGQAAALIQKLTNQ